MITTNEYLDPPASHIAKRDPQMREFLDRYFQLAIKPNPTETEQSRLDQMEQLINNRKETYKRRQQLKPI